MTTRLGDDHDRAKKLAEGLRQIEGVILDSGSPYTNMIYFNLADSISLNAQQVAEKMKDFGVFVDPDDWRRFRLVTHYWVDDDAVEKSISAFKKVLQ
jgi:threonine aldolase